MKLFCGLLLLGTIIGEVALGFGANTFGHLFLGIIFTCAGIAVLLTPFRL